ncbi:hypothetical protein [Streptomyces sp. NPDC058739]|uniref:hypothetical protein n=1 Tax=Streptomyces sp. NPDC058739 TaxID=3346618 RepID=UPI0036B1B204
MSGAGGGWARRRTTAAAIAAAVLMATAGCGGGDEEDRPDARSTRPSGPKPLTKGQLLAAVLVEGDVGAYTSEQTYDDEGPVGDLYTARPEVCQPLVSLADVSDSDAEPGVFVDLQLRSYTAEDATAVMKALGKAGESCADGFTEERVFVDAEVLRVETLRAPAAGDEAHAFRITTQDVKNDSLKLYEYLTVVRSGSTTLSFRAYVLGTEDVGGVPQDAVDARWEKYRRTTP